MIASLGRKGSPSYASASRCLSCSTFFIHSVFLRCGTAFIRRSVKSLISQQIPRSTGTFFPISARSQSTWIFVAESENFSVFPVALSENLTPSAIMRSAFARATEEAYLPCIPCMPKNLGESEGISDKPIMEHPITASSLSASLTMSSPIDVLTAPPPK